MSETWSESNSASFIHFGNYFVPDRELQTRAFCQLIPDPGVPFEILELACGEGVLAEALLDHFPIAHLTGLDGSPTMLTAASTRLGRFRARFNANAFNLASPDWRHPSIPPYAVVSSLVIHHLDDSGKENLFRDIFQMLLPGGVFLAADIILPESRIAINYAAAAYDETVRKRALSIDGNLKMYNEFIRQQWNFFRYPDDPMDKPSSLLAQIHWLKTAGFNNVEVYWMSAGHALFGGRK